MYQKQLVVCIRMISPEHGTGSTGSTALVCDQWPQTWDIHVPRLHLAERVKRQLYHTLESIQTISSIPSHKSVAFAAYCFQYAKYVLFWFWSVPGSSCTPYDNRLRYSIFSYPRIKSRFVETVPFTVWFSIAGSDFTFISTCIQEILQNIDWEILKINVTIFNKLRSLINRIQLYCIIMKLNLENWCKMIYFLQI